MFYQSIINDSNDEKKLLYIAIERAFLSFITLAPAVICASEQENFMFPSQGSSSQWRAILSDDWDVRVLSSTVTI